MSGRKSLKSGNSGSRRKIKHTSYGLRVAQTIGIYLSQIKSQNKIRVHVTKQHKYNTNQTTLIPNNLIIMVDMISLVGILRDSYKISITTRNTLH